MYEEIIKHYQDFPIPGIDFIDIMPFLQNKDVFNSLIRDIDKLVDAPNVVTAEARGFLFAAPLLTVSDKVRNIIPARKKGKLPFAKGDLKDVAIMKEYGAADASRNSCCKFHSAKACCRCLIRYFREQCARSCHNLCAFYTDIIHSASYLNDKATDSLISYKKIASVTNDRDRYSILFCQCKNSDHFHSFW